MFNCCYPIKYWFWKRKKPSLRIDDDEFILPSNTRYTNLNKDSTQLGTPPSPKKKIITMQTAYNELVSGSYIENPFETEHKLPLSKNTSSLYTESFLKNDTSNGYPLVPNSSIDSKQDTKTVVEASDKKREESKHETSNEKQDNTRQPIPPPIPPSIPPLPTKLQLDNLDLDNSLPISEDNRSLSPDNTLNESSSPPPPPPQAPNPKALSELLDDSATTSDEKLKCIYEEL